MLPFGDRFKGLGEFITNNGSHFHDDIRWVLEDEERESQKHLGYPHRCRFHDLGMCELRAVAGG